MGFEPMTPSLRSLCNNHYATQANTSKPVARFELATLCLQGRCNNHYATPANYNNQSLHRSDGRAQDS